MLVNKNRRWFVSDDRLWADSLGLHMRDDLGDNKFALADFSTLVLRTVDVGTFAPRDSGLRLSESDAQQLMDELWRAGVRPRNGSGALAHVEATHAHLEDLRRLVFKGLPE